MNIVKTLVPLYWGMVQIKIKISYQVLKLPLVLHPNLLVRKVRRC